MFTELIEKYMRIKREYDKKYRDCVLLMQVGSFYEVYGFDCVRIKFGNVKRVSEILNSHMTRKNKTVEHNIKNPYMCGFPCCSLSKHLSTLLKNNMTVVIYNQIDNDDMKKRKDHELFGVFSPSTYIEEDIIDNNNLMCIIINEFVCPIHNIKMKAGYLSTIDLSTGINSVYEFYDDIKNQEYVMNEINKLLNSVNPCEILTNVDYIKEIQ